MRRLNKYLMVILAALFAVASIVIGMKYSSAKMPTQEPASTGTTGSETNKSEKPQEENKIGVKSLYLNDEFIFLSEDMSDSYLAAVEKTVDQGNSDDVHLFEQAKVKWNIQKQLNELYQQPVLVGSLVIEAAQYKAETTSAEIQAVANALGASGIQDDFAKTVQTILGPDHQATTDSSKLSDFLSDGDQSQAVLDAKERLSHIIVNGVPVDGFTLDAYYAAKDAVSKVSPGPEHDAMVAEIGIVENLMRALNIEFK